MRPRIWKLSALYTAFRRFNSSFVKRFQIDQAELQTELEEPVLRHLQKRNLISNTTANEELSKLVEKAKIGIYCGADPTAISLHLGNLLPLLVLLHFNIRGHNIIGLVGGATGAVGDPSGRTTERDSMNEKIRLNNVDNIQKQMKSFFENGVRYAKFLSIWKTIEEGSIDTKNNLYWWKDVTMLEFLANYGRHIRVSQMLARDSVKGRLESENGIGFNEFTYQVLQAYDFWHLFRYHNVSLQVGGNDQWGNITAGIDLITRLRSVLKNEHTEDKTLQKIAGRASFGLTVPLLTTASGEKFGKSAGNAVFIDKTLTSPFDLYQYFMKATDTEVEKLLKIFTFIPLSQISKIMISHNKDPSLRTAQRILANEATDLIHGVGSGDNAAIITSILYPLPDVPYPSIPSNKLIAAFKNAGILKNLPKYDYFGKPFSLIVSELQKCSKNEARKLVSNGAIYFGYNRIRADPSDSMLISDTHLLDSKLLLLRIGKGKYHVVNLV